MNYEIQDTMMNSLMIETWKNINTMHNVMWPKDVFLNKDIKSKQIGFQTLAFHKNAVDYFYKATLLTQDQIEKMAEPLLKNIPVVPEGWSDMFKKNQEQIKKTVDESFVKAESFLSSDSDVKKQS